MSEADAGIVLDPGANHRFTEAGMTADQLFLIRTLQAPVQIPEHASRFLQGRLQLTHIKLKTIAPRACCHDRPGTDLHARQPLLQGNRQGSGNVLGKRAGPAPLLAAGHRHRRGPQNQLRTIHLLRQAYRHDLQTGAFGRPRRRHSLQLRQGRQGVIGHGG